MNNLNTLKDLIASKRKVAPSTLKTYIRRLKVFIKIELPEYWEDGDTTEPIQEILNNEKDKIIKILDKFVLTQQKNIIGAILVGLSPEKGNPNEEYMVAFEEYKKILKTKQLQYEKDKKEQKKTPKEKINWSEKKELDNVLDNYIKEWKTYEVKLQDKRISGSQKRSKEGRELLKKILVASLYLYLPPRRLEYADTMIMDKKQFDKLQRSLTRWKKQLKTKKKTLTFKKEDGTTKKKIIKLTKKQLSSIKSRHAKLKEKWDNTNYLVNYSLTKKFFHWGDYKTRKSNGVVDIQIKGRLNSILNLYLKFREPKSKWLLLNTHKEKLTKNGLTKYLVKVFKPTGKKISVNMLRKIYISDYYKNDKKLVEREQLAKMMGHSKGMAQMVYEKKDD